MKGSHSTLSIGRKWIAHSAVLIAMIGAPLTLSAQDAFPRIEVFGGYSHLGKQSNPYGPTGYIVHGKSGLNGWNLSIAGNFNSWIGAEADFAGYSGEATAEDNRYFGGITTQTYKTHTYLFGPRVAFRSGRRFTPFLHFLLGGVKLSNGRDDYSGLAFAFGGGLDLSIARHVAIRAIQADFVQTRLHQGSAQQPNNNGRLSFGMVVRF